MSRPIDGEPRPRADPVVPATTVWPVSEVAKCAGVAGPKDLPFSSILESRRSHSDMCRAPMRDVVNAVAFAVRPRAVLKADRFGRSRRPSPSAGAIHPVEVLLVQEARVFRYEALGHELQVLRVSRPGSLRAFRQDCKEILPGAAGTALVLVGDGKRVDAMYERPSSLLWRDAGVLLQTLALVATAYGLAFCPLGILGGSVVDSIGLAGEVRAAGVALVGYRQGGARRAV